MSRSWSKICLPSSSSFESIRVSQTNWWFKLWERMNIRVHLLIQWLYWCSSTYRIFLDIRASFYAVRCDIIVFRKSFLNHWMDVMNHILTWAKNALYCCLRRHVDPQMLISKEMERTHACILQSNLVMIAIRLIFAKSYITLTLFFLFN